MISAIVPTSSSVFAVFAGAKGEVVFSRVQCWAVTDIVQERQLVGRMVTGIALRDGMLAPCNGVNITNFVGYDESDVTLPRAGRTDAAFATPDPAPWVEKCTERRVKIEEERAAALRSKIVLPGSMGAADPAWSAAKDLKALRNPENPLS